MMQSDVPEQLATIVDNFHRAPKALRLPLLLEFSRKLPELPKEFDSSEMERVEECQTPFYVATKVDDSNAVRIYFDAPPQAPSTRGFAGVLFEGLDGQPAEAILAVPDDFYTAMNLAEVMSPLRLHAIAAIIQRLKRQVREQVE